MIYYLICQRHGYLCDLRGSSKKVTGYNWTRYIKAAHRFPTFITARDAALSIGLDPDACVAEMREGGVQ